LIGNYRNLKKKFVTSECRRKTMHTTMHGQSRKKIILNFNYNNRSDFPDLIDRAARYDDRYDVLQSLLQFHYSL
jgi:hypothetical protein